jgi:two-component system chemotaxis response regulator CheY
MRSLIVEDEFTSRMQIKYFLEEFGSCDIAVNGTEAVQAFKMALEAKKYYDLICLDIKLPKKDGHHVLAEIRLIEKEMGNALASPARIFMTTAISDIKDVADAYYGLCDEYLSKPIEKEQLIEKLRKYDLI